MSLESLVEEIRSRATQEISGQQQRIALEKQRIATERDRRVAAAQADARRHAEIEITRERAQKLAAAKLQARKLLFEAREKRMTESLQKTRALLAEYARSSEYPKVLQRMYTLATGELGKTIRVSGRSEDASVLRGLAGKNFDATPLPILGGLVAEAVDGSRRLNLAFDELLRLREDRVRQLLAE